MPRKVEVQSADGSSWEPWSLGGDAYKQYPWRYVGGVLEYLRDGMWTEVIAPHLACLTLDEIRSKPGYRDLSYRLRPYEDAPRTTRERMMDDMIAAGIVAPGFITSTTEVSGERLLEEWQDHVTDKAAELIRQAREKIELRRVTCEHERHRLVGEQWICSDCGHKWKATSWDQSEAARANRLSDECGSLRSELNEAYAKIGRQERELERLRRKR